MYRRILAPFLGSLLVAGLVIGCGDLPVQTELTDGYPVEKLDVESGDISPEVLFHLNESGISGSDADDLLESSVGNRGRGDQARGRSHDHPGHANGRGSDHARDDAASILRRALASLDLNERQRAAIEDCYDEYRSCIRSARERARAARGDLYDDFRARMNRIRNAVENGTLTREDAREHMLEAIHSYRAAVRSLHERLKAAEADCLRGLKECVSSVLTDEQLARLRELIANGGDRGGDRGDDGGRGRDRGDDGGRGGDRGDDGDRAGDRGDDGGRGGDRGGDRGDDGDRAGDRGDGGDRGGDDGRDRRGDRGGERGDDDGEDGEDGSGE